MAPAKTVGRRFTKKEVLEPGFVHLEADGKPSPKWAQSVAVRLDPEDYFDPKRTKNSAMQTLLSAGYASSDLYGEGGYCHALERVRKDNHEDDSPVGLAAHALWHCRQLELVADLVHNPEWQRAAAHAYAIGRLDAFRKAYTLTSGQTSDAAKEPRSGNALRTKIVDFFRTHRAEGGKLKTALEALETPQGGLLVEFDAELGKWRAEDQNATGDEAEAKLLGLKALEACWTDSGKPPQS